MRRRQPVRRFRNWNDISCARIEDLGQMLRPIGLWRRRAGALKALATEMVRRRGSFPTDRREIESLPAIGQYVIEVMMRLPRPEGLMTMRAISQFLSETHTSVDQKTK